MNLGRANIHISENLRRVDAKHPYLGGKNNYEIKLLNATIFDIARKVCYPLKVKGAK